ncbi:MAG TPA: L-fucose/L-arabinose isomerase family protein [Solirubrobacteraceae bacterium]|jgi:L-fucose isomerase|nr:L-fucose/L-arabinose isomerase family protein [Solirubrobacteraceae bacterium]
MATVALMTVSDGREYVHREIESFESSVEAKIAQALERLGNRVVTASSAAYSNETAVAIARELAAHHPDLTIINIPVWAFPHFTMLAVKQIQGPVALFSNIDPSYPGMVGMLAAAGSLDQIGRTHERVWGDVNDINVLRRLDSLVRAGAGANALNGSTFGRIGGRPMGMYTAVSPADLWLSKFGIDVEEIDQYELVRRSSEVPDDDVTRARQWLEQHTAGVHYDGGQLTPELLERQIRVYYVMKQLIEEWSLDFCGIKGQPELTSSWCTADIAEAFLNDPYDWDGPKEPVICATEADMDAALTMQILKHISKTPVLFADVRHYHDDLNIWDLCNSGQHATWFAARSDDPAENLARVHLYPEVFYFPAGGASVAHIAAAGEMTFARLTRLDGRYRMQVIAGGFEQLDDATSQRLAHASTFEWPHAFARFDADADEILSRYGSNHIHAVPGDRVGELRSVCRFLDVDFDGFGSLR